MNKTRQWFILGGFLYFILSIFIYFLFPNFTDGFQASDIIYVVSSAFPVLALAYALRFFGFKKGHGRALFYMFLSFLCLFIGEVLWSVFEYIDVDPYPSAADYFYILSYPLLFIGLYKEVKLLRVNWSISKDLSNLIMGFIGLGLLVFVGYFGVYYAYDPVASHLENTVAIAYGVGDLALIILALMVLKITDEFRGGSMFFIWLTIFTGLMFTLIADIGFAIYYEPYEEGVLSYNVVLDLLWMGSFITYAYGFYGMGNIIRNVQEKVKKQLQSEAA